MKEVITMPQKSDMGDGFGYLDGVTNCTLREVLDFYVKNSKDWGTVCIYNGEYDIIRKFDYDTYNKNVFYHNLSGWVYNLTVKKVEFKYCFMNKDINIYLN